MIWLGWLAAWGMESDEILAILRELNLPGIIFEKLGKTEDVIFLQIKDRTKANPFTLNKHYYEEL